MKDLVLRNRSYRRFDQACQMTEVQLLEWIDLARLSPSSRNQQALKFITVYKPEENARIFDCLAWAGYLRDWPGPVKGERPTGYIVIVGDTSLGTNFEVDMGIAAQTILLGAVSEGFGGCMIGSIQREELTRILPLDNTLSILLVIALGKPIEEVVIDQCVDGNIKYWRDENEVHHVPKRSIREIVLPI